MSKINILSSDVYNKISAGEVVERPLSVVKELVENSVDASATKVDIYASFGGRNITVFDNGCGIDKDDLQTAFLKHTTSKISVASDLNDIQTLGFRGEALSSIASVSQVELVSRTKTQDTAYKICLDGGETVNISEISANIGTKITVENLFYNTPARLKFLKKPSREMTEIKSYVEKFILTNPYIEIKYYADGELVYQFSGRGLEEAIFCVYGKTCLKNCIKIDSNFNNIKVYGYVGSLQYTKSNSNNQICAINGRYVEDSLVSVAVKNAFKPYLMTRVFPFYVLNLYVPTSEIDVNVHPNKLEVRYAQPNNIYIATYMPIKNILSEQSKKGSYYLEEAIVDGQKAVIANSKCAEQQQYVFCNNTDPEVAKKNYERIEAQRLDFARQFNEYIKKECVTRRDSETNGLINSSKNINTDYLSQNEPTIIDDNSANDINHIDSSSYAIVNSSVAKSDVFAGVKIIGILFDTFVILEKDDKILILDQHAAHERILYDKFLTINSPMQELLVPFVFNVADYEREFIEDNIPQIIASGFEIEAFGDNSYKINAVSVLFSNIALDKFVKGLLGSINEFKFDSDKLKRERIARLACHNAVRAGDKLNENQIRYILEQLQTNGNFNCPHGRPIVVVKSKTEIEKWFKRIV